MEPANPVAESDSAKLPDVTTSILRSGDVDWANHFWDEYKYRHETWWQTFYHSMWFIGILLAVPWIPWAKEKFAEIAQGRGRVVYGIVPIFFFAVVVAFLVDQFDEKRLAECKLERLRGNKEWAKPVRFAAFKELTGVMTFSFLAFVVSVWLIWFTFLLRIRP